MKKDWFVIQTLTGKEGKVKESIEARVKKEEMHEYIGTCLIPTEKVTETKDGKKRTINRKVFPGYVLVEMALYTGGEVPTRSRASGSSSTGRGSSCAKRPA